MSVPPSQRFLYFQNKATHYHRLRNVRSSIDHSPPRSSLPRQRVFRPVPYNQQHDIEVANQHLVGRLVGMARCQRTEVAADGSYSRWNKLQRPFREQSPLKAEQERSVTLDNDGLNTRLRNVRAAVGSNSLWSREHVKQVGNRKNLSRYVQESKLKGELHLSTDKFVPQHLRDYATRKHSLNGHSSVKPANAVEQKQVQLPQISRKEEGSPAHLKETGPSFPQRQGEWERCL